VIDEATARNGEQPSTERRFVAGEPREPGHHLQPCVRREVLAGSVVARPQIGDQRNMEFFVQVRDARCCVRSGRVAEERCGFPRSPEANGVSVVVRNDCGDFLPDVDRSFSLAHFS
jgi:hypothetical protein